MNRENFVWLDSKQNTKTQESIKRLLNTKKSENNTNTKEKVTMKTKFTGDYSIAAIHFYGTSKIYYFVSYDELAVDDYVVCDTSRGYSVGQVVAVYDKLTAELNQSDIRIENITKEIVCKIDITPFKTRKENRIKKARLKEQLDKAIKEDDDLFLYTSIAEHNPKIKALLEQYQSL